MTSIVKTKNYNECMKYIADLEHFYLEQNCLNKKVFVFKPF